LKARNKIEEQRRISGIITPHEVKRIERARWPYTTVEDAMRPFDRLRITEPETPVTDALMLMACEYVNQLPVVRDTRLTGIICRGDVIRLLGRRAELQV
jgi:predicted transcriptional regulator